MMASEQLVVDDDDDEEWPNLVCSASTTATIETKQQRTMSSPQYQTTMDGTGGSSSNHSHEDWEMLHPETSSSHSSTPETRSPSHNSFEMIGDDDEDSSLHLSPSKVVQAKPHSLPHQIRHCMSSPNLGCSSTVIIGGSSLLANNTNGSTILDAVVEEDDHDDTFSLITGPASVMTASTTMTISFRDAAAWSMIAAAPTNESQIAAAVTDQSQAPKRTRRVQSKLVVVPSSRHVPNSIRRCSKSTGDLQSLCKQVQNGWHEEDDDGYGPSSSSGVCDTMEFYNRKALGSMSRSNGLKLRPDEAKRRNIILLKKEQQRQQRK